MNHTASWLAIALALAGVKMHGAEIDTAPARLRVGIVQMSLGASIAENRDRILSGIAKVADQHARVAVFPESALRGRGADDPALVDEAVSAIRRAAREHEVYVLFGGATPSPGTRNDACWMRVLGPDGSDVFRYDKLYDRHDAKMPEVFRIDGVPSSALLCADRWLRGVEEIPIRSPRITSSPSRSEA